jgi:hypothetical protein
MYFLIYIYICSPSSGCLMPNVYFGWIWIALHIRMTGTSQYVSGICPFCDTQQSVLVVRDILKIYEYGVLRTASRSTPDPGGLRSSTSEWTTPF